ncbi:MAG: RNA 2',3'-cyclic phosphodiesterase, partial [Proteobacteria bacterium]|nr:RNA 2',3'-cyclic phosphodiesterase [Pseudomonadota bacterium]
KIRSFLAFELPPVIKGIVERVSREVRTSPLEASWVKPENIHLTIVFLGNIETEEIESVGGAVQKVCMEHRPFPLSLKPMGCFPNSRRPRVIWLGLEGDLERMSRFRDEIQQELKPFGIKEEERPLKPHLTLGRFKKPNRMEAQLNKLMSYYADLSSPVCSLHELILFKSDLRPGGAVYTKMKSFPLAGEG